MFGPQKGVTEEMKQPLDAAMARYGQAVAKAIGTDYMQEPGTGAARWTWIRVPQLFEG